MKQCYYSILDVPPDASIQEIKKSYRKKALLLHPDKLQQRGENAQETERNFEILQEAYEILSDEKERKWYDNNKTYILRDESTMGRNSDWIGVEQVLPFHTISCFKGYSPSTNLTDFFSVYRIFFEGLLKDEDEAVEKDPDYIPAFAPDRNVTADFGNLYDVYCPKTQSPLYLFYSIMCNFSSCKSFSWHDPYNPLDYQSRPERRIAEKKNKKSRDDKRKEYNTAVRDLCSFVKARDPRVRQYLQDEKSRTSSTSSVLNRDEMLKTQKEDLIANYVEPEWSKIDQTELENEDYQEDVVQVFECVVCDRQFKSLKQLENHENSKKHLEELEILRVQLEMEDVHLGDSNEQVADTTKETFNCIPCQKEFSTQLQLSAHEQSKKHRTALKAQKKK